MMLLSLSNYKYWSFKEACSIGHYPYLDYFSVNLLRER